jgi:hypothetical protein
MATPIVSPIPTRPSEIQSWGSEGLNPAFGAREAPKRNWATSSTTYQDIAALERFGVDPLAPPTGKNVVLASTSYGYPIDGYTTGYTVKLPPSGADITVASKVPISGLQPSVVASSAGGEGAPITGVPSDEPVADQIAGVDWSNPWRRGEALAQIQAQQKTAALLSNPTLTHEQKIAMTRYLNNEYGVPSNASVPSAPAPAPAPARRGGRGGARRAAQPPPPILPYPAGGPFTVVDPTSPSPVAAGESMSPPQAPTRGQRGGTSNGGRAR